MKVAEIMARDPVKLRQTDSLSKAAAVFNRHNIDSVPVTDHRQHLQGIFSKKSFSKL